MISIIFWVCALILAVSIIFINNIIINILIYGLFGVLASGAYFFMGAPDVSFASLAIGSAFTTFVFLISIKNVGTLKVFYLISPYMLQKDERDNLWGFEYDLLTEFAARNKMNIDFFEISNLDQIKTNYDIIVGGLYPEKDIFTDYKLEQSNCVNTIPNKVIYDYENDEKKWIDIMSMKEKIIKGLKKAKEDYRTMDSNYIIIINKNSKDLIEQFKEFMIKFKQEKDFDEIVKRNLG